MLHFNVEKYKYLYENYLNNIIIFFLRQTVIYPGIKNYQGLLLQPLVCIGFMNLFLLLLCLILKLSSVYRR